MFVSLTFDLAKNEEPLSNRCHASSNRCHASSNRCLASIVIRSY